MKLSTKWSEGQDLESLVRAEALLRRLYDVLEDELAAISRYDLKAMAQIDDEKQSLVSELEDLVSQSNSESQGLQSCSEESNEALCAIRARVPLAAGQVRAMIYANSALLGEAIAAITAKLGVDSNTCGYDSRARTVGPARQSSTRSI